MPFSLEAAGVGASGFAGRPVDASARRDVQHVFVNGRLVQDRVLTHAIARGVRRHAGPGPLPGGDPLRRDRPVRGSTSTSTRKRRRSDSTAPPRCTTRCAPPSPPRSRTTSRCRELRDLRPRRGGAPNRRPAPTRRADSTPGRACSRRRSAAVDPGRRAVPLAQYKDSYIVAQDREGLLLVDQHVAHERVLFERFLTEAERGEVHVQRLLFPKTIELADRRGAGFRLGGGGVRAPRFPARAVRRQRGEAGRRSGVRQGRRSRSADSRAARRGGARREARPPAPSDLRRKLVTSAACQAAIKVNYPSPTRGCSGFWTTFFSPKTRRPARTAGRSSSG